MAGYVVQTARGTATTANGTVTFTTGTRAGNSLIAMASVRNAGASNGTLTAVTLGGVKDNFQQVAHFGTGTSPAQLYWWLDPICAGGQTSVVFTTTGGAGAEALIMDVLEVGGLIPLPPASGGVDLVTSGTVTTPSADWSSGSAGTNWPTEIWTGMVSAAGTHPASLTIYNPFILLPSQTCGGTTSLAQAGYLLYAQTGETGSTLQYYGTFTASQNSITGAVAFPAITYSPDLPDYEAGFGPQQGDIGTLVTAPLGFTQQKVVVRVAQLFTTTELPTGNALQYIGFDTVLEDPYQAWNVENTNFTPPFTGWYHCTQTVNVGTCAASTIISLWNGLPCGGLVTPTGGGGIVQGSSYRFLVANQSVDMAAASASSTTNVFTSNSPGSTMEIFWIGFSAA